MITRPVAEAEATAARLQALGWTPVMAPMLHIHPQTPEWPAGIDAVVVTSGNALAGAAPLRHLPLFAVGDATARRAAENGFRHVQSASGDAGDLASLLQTTLPPGAVLALPTAEGEGMGLTDRLRAHGFDVRRTIAYRVDPAHEIPPAATQALRAGTLHAALFLSARTAATFAGLLPPGLHPALAGVQALAIGQPAADHLAPLPWGRVRVSLAPTLDQVLALL